MYHSYIAKKIGSKQANNGKSSNPAQRVAVIAIALSIVIMLLTVATGVGLKEKIREKLSVFQGHLQLTHLSHNEDFATNHPIKRSSIDTCTIFKKDHQIAGTSLKLYAYACKTGIVRTDKDFEGIVLKGVGVDYDWGLFRPYLIDGRIPNTATDAIIEEVIISKILSNRLGIAADEDLPCFFIKRGETIPRKRALKVVGIYETGFEQFDRNFVMGSLGLIQKMNQWQTDQIGGFEIFIKDFSKLTFVAQEVYEQTPMHLNSRSLFERYPMIFNWLNLFDNNIAFIIGMMIAVSVLSIIIALMVLIIENVRVVGILKTLGMTHWNIRWLFLYKGGLLIIKGLFWGDLMGLAIILLQQTTGIFTLDASVYYVSKVPVYLSIGNFLCLNIGVLTVCSLLLLLPSYMVVKISPSRVIRFR